MRGWIERPPESTRESHEKEVLMVTRHEKMSRHNKVKNGMKISAKKDMEV